MKRPVTKPHRARAGQPAIVYDLKVIQALGEQDASLSQIASHLGVDPATVDNWNKTPAFRRARKRGKDKLRLALKAKQIRVAMSDGHASQGTMLVWLGKNLLKQRDKSEHSGPNGAPLFSCIERIIIKPTA